MIGSKVVFWVWFIVRTFFISCAAMFFAFVVSIVLVRVLRGEVIDVLDVLASSLFDVVRGGAVATGAVCVLVLINYFKARGKGEDE